jgi:DNA-binding NtrC family response regulator
MSESARIMIVDDDHENGQFLQDKLTFNGCKAQWFPDPRKALAQFRKGQYQVGILDLKMPHMSGVELFQHLREKDPEIGVIILTGFPSVDTALTAMKTGAYDYLKKPYKMDDLQPIVQRLLEEKGVYLHPELAINQRIGRRIKDYRLHQRWTITRLAIKTHLSKSLISQLENGKNSPSVLTLLKIARALNKQVKDLVQDL